MIDDQQEISEMRREIQYLRRDFVAWKTAKPRQSETRLSPAERTGFVGKFQTAIAGQLHHQHELFRIQRRISALEKRVMELERRCRPNVPVN